MFESKADILSKDILTEKYRLTGEGKNPRLVLLSEEEYNLLNEKWIKDLKDLPFGDSIAYELQRRGTSDGVFLADGTIFGMWVVKVETVERFKVY